MTLSVYSPERYMKEAYRQAQMAYEKGEVPVGAVIVSGAHIIARGHNQVELLNDPTAHAEMLAITSATEFLGSKYLEDCIMFVTLEPCMMCAGAMNWARLESLYFGASDEKRGFTLLKQPVLHPKTKVYAGIMKDECRQLLEDFFKNLREQ